MWDSLGCPSPRPGFSKHARTPGRFNRLYFLRSPIGYDGHNWDLVKLTLILIVVLGWVDRTR